MAGRLVVALALLPCLGADDFFVALDGDDTNGGTKVAPFATLQHCVDRLLDDGSGSPAPAGSACWLRGGEYRLDQAVDIEGLHGTAERYVISGYEDEEVVLVRLCRLCSAMAGWRVSCSSLRERWVCTQDGTYDVNPASWAWTGPGSAETGGAGHWVTTLPADSPEPWQLFVDAEPMVGARWPNADWATKTMFTSDTWVGSTSESTYNGYTNPTHATYTGNENLGEPSLLVSTPCTEPARAACAGHVLDAARNPAGQLINATGGTKL